MRGYDSDVRIRVIAVYRMLLRGKPITLDEIMLELKEKYGIVVDRKTLYSDIAAVDRFVPVKVPTGRGNNVYRLWDVLGEAGNGN